ncbi:MAG: hypothetical protein IJW83_05585 [Clostridia bacterium]|nr:hypothetical protein [Clostridia bacterium]
MTDDTDKSERIAALVERLMEQPQLLETVSALLNETPTATPPPSSSSTEDDTPASVEPTPERDGMRSGDTKDRRHQLLCALRPYLSDRRAKALDSFEAIANLLDFMKQT